MSAYVVVINDATLHGDAYASGEPASSDAWVIIATAARIPDDPRIRVFPCTETARKWRDERIAFQRARGRTHVTPRIVPVSDGRLTEDGRP